MNLRKMKPRITNPGGYKYVQARTILQKLLEDGPQDSTMLYVCEVCNTMSNVGCTEICTK